jgi:hypothetical protein
MKILDREENVEMDTAHEVAAMETKIRGRLGRQVVGFRIMVADEQLILRGRAPTYYAKQLAQQAVMDATSLPILANEIEVARSHLC